MVSCFDNITPFGFTSSGSFIQIAYNHFMDKVFTALRILLAESYWTNPTQRMSKRWVNDASIWIWPSGRHETSNFTGISQSGGRDLERAKEIALPEPRPDRRDL